MIKYLRPDRLLQAMSLFARKALMADLSELSTYRLADIVTHEMRATTPMSLVSIRGYDASYRIEALVTSIGMKCTSVAMGSQEGFTLADQAIALASRQGNWVLLKNVHLASAWLGQLEKKLQTLNAHTHFRLFLTMESNTSIPVNILRQSHIIMNEPAAGIKANLMDSLRGISSTRLLKGPAEKPRLYFLLAWFHAVVQERLRYVPLGWSKVYDFNDSDLASAFNTIDTWFNSVSQGRANVNPAAIPWEAIRTLIKQSVYGGRVDSDFDQKILDSFVDDVFTSSAYNVDFELVSSSAGIASVTVPEGTKLDQFLTWVQSLPDKEPPAWLRLPPSTERVIAVAQGKNTPFRLLRSHQILLGAELLNKLRKMQALTDEDEDGAPTSLSAKGEGTQQPIWMRTLSQQCHNWLNALPEVGFKCSSMCTFDWDCC